MGVPSGSALVYVVLAVGDLHPSDTRWVSRFLDVLWSRSEES